MDQSELLTVDDAARTLGIAADEVRGLILAGSVAHRLVPGAGGALEVRVERSSLADLSSVPATQRSAGEVCRHEPGVAVSEPPAASGEGDALTVPPELRALASNLADELFQRWQLAMETHSARSWRFVSSQSSPTGSG